MYIIRETFAAKPGMASKLARLMREMRPPDSNGHVRVMTDAVGRFNTVVVETEVGSLADFEREMREYAQASRANPEMKSYTEMYLTGKRQIFHVVE